MERKMELVITEIKGTAAKEDIDALRKYIDLWDPVKFVTIETVEKLIEDKIETKKKGKKTITTKK